MPSTDARRLTRCANDCSSAITSTTCWRLLNEKSPVFVIQRLVIPRLKSLITNHRSPMGKVVGIDLGTTNSLVAYVDGGKPVVMRDESGDGLVPSVVSVGEDGTIYVGREAQRRLMTAPSRTVYSVKRFMGRGIEDVHGEAALLPFRVSGDPGGVVRIGIADREFTPPEISAFVLRELKR